VALAPWPRHTGRCALLPCGGCDGSLIEGGVKNELSSSYTLGLNKKMARLFGDSQ
jgi:hypothetical protein